MKKIFAILATAVLAVTILMSPVYAESSEEATFSNGSTSVIAAPTIVGLGDKISQIEDKESAMEDKIKIPQPKRSRSESSLSGVPDIEVTKTVWNETASEWEDEITAELTDTVEFKSTIKNSGSCTLTDITVTDMLSDSFEFLNCAPMYNGKVDNPDGTTTLTWYPDPLAPSKTVTYRINVTVIECGIDTNVQYAEAEGCGETVSGSDTATVKVPGAYRGIEVVKDVWDGAAWVDVDDMWVGETALFKSTIRNIGECCDLTDIIVTDTLSKSLKYAGVQGDTPEPDDVINNTDGTTTLEWFLPGPLVADDAEEFYILADITVCLNGTNTQKATGESCGDVYPGEDTARVTVSGPCIHILELNKTVWNGSAWVGDVITVNSSDVVQFNVTVKNAGECCNFTNIQIWDLLSNGFEYVDATPSHDGIIESPYGWTELIWYLDPLAPSETVTILINARATTAGECLLRNDVHVNAQFECVDGDSNGLGESDGIYVKVVGEPKIEVNKTVWNETASAWVDEITANVSDTVIFNSTIKNTGKCCDLTNITVKDILSSSLAYLSADPEPEGVDEKPDGTTELTWFLPGPLGHNVRETYIIRATIINCGVDTNTQYAEAESPRGPVTGEDTATVNVPGVPGIEVEKRVWNGTAWVESISDKRVGDTVKFNSTIKNTGMCCELTNITVTDTLSRSLEYLSATPTPDGKIDYLDGRTELKWYLTGPIEPTSMETFFIDARIAYCGAEISPGEYSNTLNATAKSCEVNVFDEEDVAYVYVPVTPEIEVEKKVWNGASWVDSVTASIGDSLNFQVRIHNDGTCCNLTDIVVTDTLPAILNYTSATPKPTTITPNPGDGTTTLVWELTNTALEPCNETIINVTAKVILSDVSAKNSVTADAKGCAISVSDSDEVTVDVPGESELIEVEKKVWNGTAWVDVLTVDSGAVAWFKCTVYNHHNYSELTAITVRDVLPKSGFEFVNASPAGYRELDYPDRTELIWYPDPFAPRRTLAIAPKKNATFFINATVTECSGGINTMYAEAVIGEVEVSDDDIATVNVRVVPEIEVDKKVTNGTAWVDEITASIGETLEFKLYFHNSGSCCDLTDIVVTDTLSESLAYAGVLGDTPVPTVTHNPDGTTTLEWTYSKLTPCSSKTLRIEANVTKGFVDTNTLNVTADGCGTEVSGEYVVTVNVPGPVKPGIDVEKKVWDEATSTWVNSITAALGDNVLFKATIHNNGTCCNLTNVNATDILPDGLEFISATPVEAGKYVDPVTGTTTLTWFFGLLEPCETITLLIDADVTKYGEASNKQNATADACDGTTVSDEDYAYVSAILKPDLVITDEWLCWPDNCTICYNVTNIGEGTAPACHNTTLYVDGVAVAHDHVPVDLAPGESYIGCFDDYIWAYTPPSDNITVCADNNETVDELDEDNNCLTNIWMCGDVNGDGKVTMSDVRKVYNRYQDPNYPLELPWAADVNGDGKVTMSDVRKVYNRYQDPAYDLNCCCKVVE